MFVPVVDCTKSWMNAVMAGLVPAIHAFLHETKKARRGCPAHQGVTPVFNGLWPGMTV
jgi:hypothetical protein